MCGNEVNVKRSKKIFITVYIIVILIFIFTSYLDNYYKNLLYSQTAAKRWSDGGRYAQITCLLDPQAALTEGNIREQYKSAIDQSLTQISEEYSKWIYCYSSQTAGTIIRNDSLSNNNSLDVDIIGVGGDFFYFHPLTLLSGNYIDSEDLMYDRVIVTENVAWKLFGSNNIVGQEVTLSGKAYIIAGVVQPEDDKYSKTAYNQTEKVFILFDKLTDLSGTIATESEKDTVTLDNETPITCFELVMANPISNFAYNTVKESFEFGKGMIEIVQNSKRYSAVNLISIAKSFRSRSMILNQIRYPYWENGARAVENQMVIVLFFRIIILCFIIISTVIFIIKKLVWLKNSGMLKELQLKRRLKSLFRIKRRSGKRKVFLNFKKRRIL